MHGHLLAATLSSRGDQQRKSLARLPSRMRVIEVTHHLLPRKSVCARRLPDEQTVSVLAKESSGGRLWTGQRGLLE